MMMHRNIPFSLGFSQFPLPFHLELFLPLNKAKSESIEQKPPLEKKIITSSSQTSSCHTCEVNTYPCEKW